LRIPSNPTAISTDLSTNSASGTSGPTAAAVHVPGDSRERGVPRKTAGHPQKSQRVHTWLHENDAMKVLGKAVNRIVGPHQTRLVITNSRRLAKFYNAVPYRSLRRRAIDAYRNRFDELILENNATFLRQAS
jgi:hypothetical protein